MIENLKNIENQKQTLILAQIQNACNTLAILMNNARSLNLDVGIQRRHTRDGKISFIIETVVIGSP